MSQEHIPAIHQVTPTTEMSVVQGSMQRQWFDGKLNPVDLKVRHSMYLAELTGRSIAPVAIHADIAPEDTLEVEDPEFQAASKLAAMVTELALEHDMAAEAFLVPADNAVHQLAYDILQEWKLSDVDAAAAPAAVAI